MFRHRENPRGRSGAGACIFVRSEEAVRKRERLGLLQATSDAARRAGVPAVGRWTLLVHQILVVWSQALGWPFPSLFPGAVGRSTSPRTTATNGRRESACP